MFDSKMFDRHGRYRNLNLAQQAESSAAIFCFVLPSPPMFLVIPMLLKRGLGFWPALGLGCLLTIALYLLTTALLANAE